MQAIIQPMSKPTALNPHRKRPAAGPSTPSMTIVANGYLVGTPKATLEVSWNRHELGAILNVYGRKVAAAEWRDYAIDALKDRAVFSVFRRASEVPLFRIEKQPKLSRKQGAYQVVAATGVILKRGHDLVQVLKVLEKQKLRLVD